MCRCAHRPAHQWSSAEEVQRQWAEHLQEGVDIFQRWLATLQSGESNGPMSEWLSSVADVFKVLHHEEVQLLAPGALTEPLSVLLHFQSAYRRAEVLEFSLSRSSHQSLQAAKHGILLRYVEKWRTLVIDVVEAYRTPADRRARLHFYHGVYEPRWPPSGSEGDAPSPVSSEASVENRLLLAQEGIQVVQQYRDAPQEGAQMTRANHLLLDWLSKVTELLRREHPHAGSVVGDGGQSPSDPFAVLLKFDRDVMRARAKGVIKRNHRFALAFKVLEYYMRTWPTLCHDLQHSLLVPRDMRASACFQVGRYAPRLDVPGFDHVDRKREEELLSRAVGFDRTPRSEYFMTPDVGRDNMLRIGAILYKQYLRYKSFHAAKDVCEWLYQVAREFRQDHPTLAAAACGASHGVFSLTDSFSKDYDIAKKARFGAVEPDSCKLTPNTVLYTYRSNWPHFVEDVMVFYAKEPARRELGFGPTMSTFWEPGHSSGPPLREFLGASARAG